MKKLFIVLMIVLAGVACTPKINFNQLMKTDYANTVIEFPDSVVQFYEVQTVLDKPITKKVEPIYVSASSTIIRIGEDKIKKIDRVFKNGRLKSENIEYLDGHWMEDFAIPLDSINVSFDTAVKTLRDSSIFPESTYMTFRKPIIPPFRTQYFFGSELTFYVGVDAITGDISK